MILDTKYGNLWQTKPDFKDYSIDNAYQYAKQLKLAGLTWRLPTPNQIKEIVAENKQKRRISALEDFALEIVQEPKQDFNNAMGQESLTRFDQPKKKKNNQNKKRKPNNIIRSDAKK